MKESGRERGKEWKAGRLKRKDSYRESNRIRQTEDRSFNQSSVPMSGGRESSLAMAHEDGDEADALVHWSSISTN